MRLSVKYSFLTTLVVLGLGFWVIDVQAVNPVDIGASSASTPQAPVQEAALTPGEQDEASGVNCAPVENPHLRYRSSRYRKAYLANYGTDCYEIKNAEGADENIEAQPLQGIPESLENCTADSTSYECRTATFAAQFPNNPTLQILFKLQLQLISLQQLRQSGLLSKAVFSQSLESISRALSLISSSVTSNTSQ